MLLTLAFQYKAIKWLLPTAYFLTTLPTYLLFWFINRVVTLPFKRTYTDRIDNFLFELYCKQFIYLYFKYSSATINFYGDLEYFSRKYENSIAISNYQTEFDWLLLAAIANKQECLGRLRCVMSKNMRNIPFVGFLCRRRQFIFENKKSDANNFERLMKCMKKIDFPVWFLIFPESKKFSNKSDKILSLNTKFAIEHKLPVYSNVLMPRIDTTHAAVCTFIDRLDVFYDFTVAYTQTTANGRNHLIKAPSLSEILDDKSIEVHVLMRYYSREKLLSCLNSLDSTELISREEVVQFLVDTFYQKDRNLENLFLNSSESSHVAKGTNGELFGLKLRSLIFGFLFYSLPTLFYLRTSIGQKVFLRIYAVGVIASLLKIQ